MSDIELDEIAAHELVDYAVTLVEHAVAEGDQDALADIHTNYSAAYDIAQFIIAHRVVVEAGLFTDAGEDLTDLGRESLLDLYCAYEEIER